MSRARTLSRSNFVDLNTIQIIDGAKYFLNLSVDGELSVEGDLTADGLTSLGNITVEGSHANVRNFYAKGTPSGGWAPGYVLQREGFDVFSMIADTTSVSFQRRDSDFGNASSIARFFSDGTMQVGGTETKGLGVVDSGSNSNGSYVRFESGLQICWIDNFEVTHTGSNSGSSRLNGQWTFPIAFSGVSAQFTNLPTQNANRWIGCNRVEVISWGGTRSSSGSITTNIHFNTGTVSTTDARVFDICIVAIGVWK